MQFELTKIITLSDISAVLSAIANIILVFITAFFAYLTKKTIKEMQQQKDSGIMPVVIGEEFSFTEGGRNQECYCVECKLKNIGNGAALGIDVRFYDSETGRLVNEHYHEIDYLDKNSGVSPHIHILKEEFNGVVRYKKDDEHELSAGLDGVIVYKDIFGKEYSVNQKYSIRKTNKVFMIVPILGTMNLEFI